jgi:RNA dependent RNA polymerase
MEVFLRGVPERATGQQMSAFFQPILSKLSIENWQCQKKMRKKFATLTFLSPADAERFLSLYGQMKNDLGRDYLPPGHTNLRFQGTLLLCSQSNKSLDPLALKSLQMDAKIRQEKKTKPAKAHTASISSVEGHGTIESSSVSCGLWKYIGSTLVFRSYLEWPVHGSMRFGAKMAVIRMDSDHSIDIPYSTIQAIATEGLPTPAITFTLTEPPQFAQSVDLSDLLAVTLSLGSRGGPSRERLPALSSEHEKIAGSCLVYRVELASSKLDEHMNALSHARGIPPSTRCHINVQKPKHGYAAVFNRLLKAFATSYATLPFSVKFQVQKLAQNGYFSPKKVLKLLPEIVSLWKRSNERVCVNAIRGLFQQLPFPGPDTDAAEFKLKAIISLLKENEERAKVRGLYLDELTDSNQRAIIHRVTVTPAGIYLYGPEPEFSNRVLRKYPDHHDHFIRVNFCEEDGMRVQFHPDRSNDRIFYQRFKQILNEGITIGGRKFAFLGFSHSSLRAQSCWFMAPFFHDGHFLLDRMLIEGLGDFSRIRCPAKCAARIGQAFSETPTAVTLAPGVAQVMKDVERNGRTFSDGVGTVSMGVLQQMWAALPQKHRTNPSLFQIRFSGKYHHIYMCLFHLRTLSSLSISIFG